MKHQVEQKFKVNSDDFLAACEVAAQKAVAGLCSPCAYEDVRQSADIVYRDIGLPKPIMLMAPSPGAVAYWGHVLECLDPQYGVSASERAFELFQATLDADAADPAIGAEVRKRVSDSFSDYRLGMRRKPELERAFELAMGFGATREFAEQASATDRMLYFRRQHNQIDGLLAQLLPQLWDTVILDMFEDRYMQAEWARILSESSFETIKAEVIQFLRVEMLQGDGPQTVTDEMAERNRAFVETLSAIDTPEALFEVIKLTVNRHRVIPEVDAPKLEAAMNKEVPEDLIEIVMADQPSVQTVHGPHTPERLKSLYDHDIYSEPALVLAYASDEELAAAAAAADAVVKEYESLIRQASAVILAAGPKVEQGFEGLATPFIYYGSRHWHAILNLMLEAGSAVNAKAWQRFALTTQAMNCWVSYDRLCIISEPPTAFSMDTQNQLHREDGAAIEFRDGWGSWHLDGYPVSEVVVRWPDLQTVDEILSESNAEVKRRRIDRYGWDKLLVSSAEVLDAKVRRELDDTEEILFRLRDGSVCLKAVCSSTNRSYFMPVDASISTCDAAQEFISGKSAILELREQDPDTDWNDDGFLDGQCLGTS